MKMIKLSDEFIVHEGYAEKPIGLGLSNVPDFGIQFHDRDVVEIKARYDYSNHSIKEIKVLDIRVSQQLHNRIIKELTALAHDYEIQVGSCISCNDVIQPIIESSYKKGGK